MAMIRCPNAVSRTQNRKSKYPAAKVSTIARVIVKLAMPVQVEACRILWPGETEYPLQGEVMPWPEVDRGFAVKFILPR